MKDTISKWELFESFLEVSMNVCKYKFWNICFGTNFIHNVHIELFDYKNLLMSYFDCLFHIVFCLRNLFNSIYSFCCERQSICV